MRKVKIFKPEERGERVAEAELGSFFWVLSEKYITSKGESESHPKFQHKRRHITFLFQFHDLIPLFLARMITAHNKYASSSSSSLIFFIRKREESGQTQNTNKT